jgi:integrase
MPRKPAQQIPVVSVAVHAFLKNCEYNPQLKASTLPSIRSVLAGSDIRAGRPAFGTPLARSHLGRIAVHRVTYEGWVEWFAQRHEGAAAATRKRGGAAFNAFLAFCHEQGWLEEDMLSRARRTKLPQGRKNKDWLQPEQVAAFGAVVLGRPRFDPYRRFLWQVLLCTGVRTSEAVALQPRDLNARVGELTIKAGKGRGDGKVRVITVAEDFIAQWREHVLRFELGPNDYMFFSRRHVFDGAADRTGHWETTSKSRPAASASARVFIEAVREEAEQAVRDGDLSIDLLPEFALQPKTMRKTFACNQLILSVLGLGGMSQLQVQQALGHEDPATTQIYFADVQRYIGYAMKPVSTDRAAELILERLAELGPDAGNPLRPREPFPAL